MNTTKVLDSSVTVFDRKTGRASKNPVRKVIKSPRHGQTGWVVAFINGNLKMVFLAYIFCNKFGIRGWIPMEEFILQRDSLRRQRRMTHETLKELKGGASVRRENYMFA